MGKPKSSKRSRKIGGSGGGKFKKGGPGNKFSGKNSFKKKFDKKPSSEEKVVLPPEPDVKNPFEIRVNKKKHQVLGNRSKHDRGMPGVSRAKAIEKRKATLLPEFLQRNKSNMFIDRRIGEKDSRLTEDEKAIRRVKIEKSKQYKKKSIFSLGDEDEILTHKGAAISSMTRYEDPRDLSDSEDEFLSDMFVSNANFGGFMKMKEKQEGEEEVDEDATKTREQIIAELVLASKMRKVQKARENDENFGKIESLDNEFKSEDFKMLLNQLQAPQKVKSKPVDSSMNEDDILAMIRGTASTDKEEPNMKQIEDSKGKSGEKDTQNRSTEKENSDYDRLVKELHFESKKARPSDIPKNNDQLREDEMEAFKFKVERAESLGSDEQARLLEVYESVLQDKNGEKIHLSETLSNLLKFYLEVAVGNPTEESSFTLFSPVYKTYLDLMVPEVYSLMRMNSVGCTKRFLQHLLRERELCFSKPVPQVSKSLILLLELGIRLYPLDDVRNLIMGATLNTLSSCIYTCKCSTSKMLYRIMYCVRLFYKALETTKRYSPECVHFLWSILLCYCPTSPEIVNHTVPNVRKVRQLLNPSSTEFTEMQEAYLISAAELACKFIRMYEYLPSSVEMFSPWKTTLKTLSTLSNLPPRAKTKVQELLNVITNLKAGKQFLRIAAAKPKPLKLYEPLIDEDFSSGNRRKKMPREKQEQSRLSHKIKQEMKSAVREIKKDNAFLARQQLKDQLASDVERKRKVKDLLGTLANQEGDFKRMKRAKK